jgi:hypothetical protein
MDILAWFSAHWQGILVILSAVYGLLAAIVKICPTLPAGHWLLWLIKILGRITNNQTADAEVRAAMAKK